MENEGPASGHPPEDDHTRRAIDATDSARPADTETVQAAPSVPSTPQRIGQYRIKRAIASGGMGTVYEAQQEKPRRTVAVKLMRAGVASRSALRRFEYESQVLARLRHPGIAQVYEAGTHRDGEVTVPYFAMEYIVGAKPITDYVRQRKLSTRERMRLFAGVCEAVHHGHQKGIIHRDLKPSNVLVDSSGQVKVIDFGVARCTDSDMAVTTLQTDVGQLIGTLQYMSPEQCAADPHDIDTRSDVYALGVIFYEMLCDRLPYEIKGAALHEATRVIREEQPTKLSTLNRTLRGDVETIALKALEKDRDRRYQSASAFTADINRYLNNEAISARPPSLIYQLRVFARRNKAAFTSIAAVFAILLAATIVSTGQYLRAESARREAIAAAEEAKHERDRAVEAEQLAEQRRKEVDAERKYATQSLRFFTNMLTSVSPFGKLGRGATVEQLLDSVAGDIDKKLGHLAYTAATLHYTVGRTYYGLGRYDTAESHLQKALDIREATLGRTHVRTDEVFLALGWLYCQTGDYEKAWEAARAAQTGYEQALGAEAPETLHAANVLGFALSQLGRSAEAEKLLRKTLEVRRRTLGDLHSDTLETMNDLGIAVERQGHLDEAESLFREALEKGVETRGEEHPLTLFPMSNLADVLRRRRDLDEAERLQRRALEIRRHVLGDDHLWTTESMHSLAMTELQKGSLSEAERMFAEALASRRRTLGAANPRTLDDMWMHAMCAVNRGDSEEALKRFRAYVGVVREQRPDDEFRVANGERRLGWAFLQTGSYQEAEQLLLRSYEYFEKTQAEPVVQGEDLLLMTLDHLVELYGKWGTPEKADPLIEAELQRWRQRAQRPNASAADYNDYAMKLLTCDREDLRDPTTALSLARKAVDMLGNNEPASLDTLALAYFATGDAATAVEVAERALAALPPGETAAREEIEANVANFRAALASGRGPSEPADATVPPSTGE